MPHFPFCERASGGFIPDIENGRNAALARIGSLGDFVTPGRTKHSFSRRIPRIRCTGIHFSRRILGILCAGIDFYDRIAPMLSKIPKKKNTVLVGHDDPFEGTTNIYPDPQGTAYIIKPHGDSYDIVAKLHPSDWAFGADI